jgi:ethanolamine utilization protein EutQ
MPRQFFTAEDIKQLASLKNSDLLVLGADDVITQEAEDYAGSLGIRLVRQTAGQPSVGTEQPLPQKASLSPKIKVVHASSVRLEPFGENQATSGTNVRLRDVITSADGAPMGSGYMTLEKGEFPWTLSYDEIDVVLEGELVITCGSMVARAETGDMIFIPKGSSISFGTPSYVRFAYVTFPADWNKH